MRVGRMDRRITLRHRVVASADSVGHSAESFTAYATVWAELIEVSGREYFAAQQTQAETTKRFAIHHRTDVLETDRLTFEGNDFDITSITEIRRREGLMLYARAVKSG